MKMNDRTRTHLGTEYVIKPVSRLYTLSINGCVLMKHLNNLLKVSANYFVVTNHIERIHGNYVSLESTTMFPLTMNIYWPQLNEHRLTDTTNLIDLAILFANLHK